MKKQKNDKKAQEGKEETGEKEQKPGVQTNKCDCKKLRAEIDMLTNSLKRALADYQNLKKRVDEENRAMILAANLILLSSVLEINDDFDLVINKYTKTKSDEADWLSGIKMVKSKVDSLLESQNVQEIEVKKGDNFDPSLHEAIGTALVNEEDQDGKIIGIARNGYKMGDEVLRPTRVMVGKLEQR